MDQAVVTDLKQFIAGAITQQTADIRGDIRQLGVRLDNVETRLDNLEQKVDDGFAGIADALEAMNATFEPRLNNHERRLVRIEAAPGNRRRRPSRNLLYLMELWRGLKK